MPTTRSQVQSSQNAISSTIKATSNIKKKRTASSAPAAPRPKKPKIEAIAQSTTMAEATEPVYFWRETVEETGWISQWFNCPFYDDKDEAIIYKTAEHYMMYQKALVFEDADIAAQVLKTGSPRKVKELGRKVANFDGDKWNKHREEVVRKGNVLKFTRPVNDQGLKEKLLATGDRELVEASPFDKIWGIGFKAEDADPSNRKNWGLNLLGKALMIVRKELREEAGQQTSQ